MSDKVVCFQMLDFETSKSNSEASESNSNILVENYFFLEKLCCFKWSRFSQCFIPSTALHCLLPIMFVMLTIILSYHDSCPVPLKYLLSYSWFRDDIFGDDDDDDEFFSTPPTKRKDVFSRPIVKDSPSSKESDNDDVSLLTFSVILRWQKFWQKRQQNT